MNEITARRDVTGLTVRLDVTRPAEQVLNQLAAAYRDDPEGIGQLLLDLADANRAYETETDRSNPCEHATEWASARADAASQELVQAVSGDTELEPVEALLNRREALHLASDLTAAARSLTIPVRRPGSIPREHQPDTTPRMHLPQQERRAS